MDVVIHFVSCRKKETLLFVCFFIILLPLIYCSMVLESISEFTRSNVCKECWKSLHRKLAQCQSHNKIRTIFLAYVEYEPQTYNTMFLLFTCQGLSWNNLMVGQTSDKPTHLHFDSTAVWSNTNHIQKHHSKKFDKSCSKWIRDWPGVEERSTLVSLAAVASKLRANLAEMYIS